MSMTTEDEEKFLLDQLNGARHRLELNEKDTRLLKTKRNILEKELETIEQSIVDYMKGNGLLRFANCSLGKSTSVDVPDIEAVPEEFIRTKVTKEPNKLLIKELRPQGNWYILKESDKLTIRND